MTSMEESGPGREDVLDAPLLLSVNDGQTLPFRREWTYSEFLFLPTGPTKGLPFTCREFLGRLVLVLLFYTVLLGPPGLVFNEDDMRMFSFVLFANVCMICIGGPIYAWRAFLRNGPLKTFAQQLHFCTLVHGKHSRAVAQTLYRTGRFYEAQREPEKALECYQKITAFPMCRRYAGSAPYHSKVGQLLFSLGRYEEALEAFETCLTLRNKLEKSNFVLRLQSDLHCIGQTHERLGNLEQALNIHREALTALQERGHRRSVDSAKSLTHIGSVYASMNQYEDALENYSNALDIYLFNVGEFPRSRAIAEVYEAIGNINTKKSKPDVAKAEESFRLAIEVYRRGGKCDEDRVIQNLLRKIGDTEAQTG